MKLMEMHLAKFRAAIHLKRNNRKKEMRSGRVISSCENKSEMILGHCYAVKKHGVRFHDSKGMQLRK